MHSGTCSLAVLALLMCAFGVRGQADKYRLIQTSKCAADTECIDNSNCAGTQTCMCLHDYVINNDRTECLPVPKRFLGQCKEDIQCQVEFGPNSVCHMNSSSLTLGECACAEDAHFAGSRCYKKVELGGDCKGDNDCYILSYQHLVFCVHSVCTCTGNYHPNQDKTDCIRDTHFNQTCTSHDECVAENSHCNGVCGCPVNYVPSLNRNKCLKAADRIGDTCDETIQCTGFLMNSECKHSKCSCIEDYHPSGGKCWYKTMLDGFCDQDEQCYIKSNDTSLAVCEGKRCRCREGLEKTSDGLDCTGGSSWLLPNIYFLVLSSFLVFCTRHET